METRALACGLLTILLSTACSMAEFVPGSLSETPQPSATIVETPDATGTPTICDSLTFIADVTIPDGTQVKAGQEFVKTWRVKNTGYCTWKTSYVLAWGFGDSKMGGQTTPLAVEVAPNTMTDISVALKAPVTSGSYHSYWHLQNTAGYRFDTVLGVVIVVP